MTCKPTIEGLEMCIRNSSRLFEDACAKDLSLPTAGALLELGLEESAKGFLIFFCLDEEDMIPMTRPADLMPQFSNFITMIEKFSKEHNCEEELNNVFSRHEIKTNLLNSIGDVLESIGGISDSMISMAKDSLSGLNPKFTAEEFDRAINSQGGIGGIVGRMSDLGKAIKTVSDTTKKHGFYVDCKNSGFEYPNLSKNDIAKMAESLFWIIQTLEVVAELSQAEFQIGLDFNDLAKKLNLLKKRLG